MRQGNSVDKYTTFVETFKTKEEAEKHLEFLIAEDTLRQAHFEMSNGWIPNWKNDDEKKYHVLYNHNRYMFDSDWSWSYKYENTFYFKNSLLVQEFISKYTKELKIYFRIKE